MSWVTSKTWGAVNISGVSVVAANLVHPLGQGVVFSALLVSARATGMPLMRNTTSARLGKTVLCWTNRPSPGRYCSPASRGLSAGHCAPGSPRHKDRQLARSQARASLLPSMVGRSRMSRRMSSARPASTTPGLSLWSWLAGRHKSIEGGFTAAEADGFALWGYVWSSRPGRRSGAMAFGRRERSVNFYYPLFLDLYFVLHFILVLDLVSDQRLSLYVLNMII